MADTPLILHFTAHQGNGPHPVLTFPDQFVPVLDDTRDLALDEYVPGGNVEPGASPAFFPWFDGFAGSTHYTSGTNGASTIVATPSPGWTVNQWAGFGVVRLANYLGVPTLPMVPVELRFITSNTADTLAVTSPWTGGAPPAGQKFRIGIGRFVVYHPGPGRVGFRLSPPDNPTENLGSAWYAGLTGGVGSDIGYMRRFLRDIYKVAPYFHAIKVVYPGGASTLGPGGLFRLANDNVRTSALAAATAVGNVLKPTLAVIDVSQEDMRDALPSGGTSLLNYKANILGWMDYVMGQWSAPTMRFQLVTHADWMLATSRPGAARFIREQHDLIARERPRVDIIEMNDEAPAAAVQMVGDVAPDTQFYPTMGYDRQGAKIVETHRRRLAGIPVGPAKKGLPVLWFISDSLGVGFQPEWVVLLRSPTITGPTPPGTARPMTQRVYNRVAGALQPYDPQVNANRSGTVNLLCGPEAGMMDEIEKLFPDGFVLVKRSANGASLCNPGTVYSGGESGRWEKVANEQFPEFEADWRAALALVQAEGYYPEGRGGFIMLCTNDAAFVGGGALVASKVGLFLDDIERLTRTRPIDGPQPIAWRLPMLKASGRRPDETNAIIAALQAQASVRPHLRLVNTEDLELDRVDNLHDTPRSSIEAGERMVAAIKDRLAVSP